jgi:hypothetical protein
MVAPLLYAVGVAGASALNYGSRLLFTDPKLIGDNASRYFSGSPSNNDNQAPQFWLGGNQYEPSPKLSTKEQLSNARFMRSQGNQTGFDDEADNLKEDKLRTNLEFQSRAAKPNNFGNNTTKGTDAMAITKSTATAKPATSKIPTTSDRYQIQSMTDLQNYANQSSDRRYNTDRTSDVNFKLGSQKNQVDYAVGMDKNAVTREVGKYTSDNQLRASNYKSYADLQAALDKNVKQSGDNRYETTTKYGTQERINTYNRNTVDQTELATAQIKAGTYGLTKDQQTKAANDKTNFDNWKNYNDAQYNYTDRQNAQIKLGQDIGNANKAYSDSRLDRQNDQALSMHRFQVEQNQKNADRAQFEANKKLDREQQRADFGLRSQQIQSQIDLANRDFALRSQESAARTFDIYNSAALKNNQFSATRADIGYNRSQQGRSNLAF